VVTAALLIVVCGLALLCIRCVLSRRRLEAELSRMRGAVRAEEQPALRTRAAFIEDLELELLRTDRSGKASSLAVLGAECEQCRHDDLVEALQTAVRTVDVAYRLADSEFALILPDTRAVGALIALQRLSDSIAAAPAGCKVRVGIAEFGPGIDRHELFRNAYCALLAADKNGRASLLTYSPELEPGSDRMPAAAPVAGS
jgi:hypothetical protein